jgi:ATP-dependent RNA helicase RhlE
LNTQRAATHTPDGHQAAVVSSPDFADLDLSSDLLDALADRGYETPTSIQSEAIPHLLEGRDLLGVAQTGTGKTAAFALPILDLLDERNEKPSPRRPRALVLTPTRELASQIADCFESYGRHLRLRSTVVFGGVGQSPQVRALARGVDVLVATPGRLLDLMGQGHVDFAHVGIFVLDEADRMLDMGFLHDVRRIAERLPRERQSLLFSATMPRDIAKLARTLLRDPVRVEVTPPGSTVERVEQRVCFVDKPDKRLLLSEILGDAGLERVLVFTRTKHGADRVARQLAKDGTASTALHGNKSQGQRERALAGFRAGRVRVLVATDIAARGLDVPSITHVINFDLPNEPESYVHRIGRTARAGRAGIAISFCDPSERAYLGAIQREVGRDLDRMEVTLPTRRPQPTQRGSAGQGPRSTARRHARVGRRRARSRRG